jgi:hypothetical protein
MFRMLKVGHVIEAFPIAEFADPEPAVHVSDWGNGVNLHR